MLGAYVGDMLRQRHVVIVHEDAFVARYLADVIVRSGATVAQPVAAVGGEALLDFGATASAIVLSDTAPGGDAIADFAAKHGLPLVIVRSTPRAYPALADDRTLTAPFAAFQVVELLRDLLVDRTAHGC
jgi:hypothetical protein